MKYLKTCCVICKGEGKLWALDENEKSVQTVCEFCDGTGGHGLQPITDEEHEKYFRHSDVVELEDDDVPKGQ